MQFARRVKLGDIDAKERSGIRRRAITRWRTTRWVGEAYFGPRKHNA